ncbi:PL29 family lyase N-terminal domain-containing protein [Phocaeicola plebeius]
MKYIKSYILLALMVLAVTGCKQEDLKDDVNALKDRVTLLEEQVKLLNENIAFFSKVLVRQTVDNGDGTFTEVPAYSISEVLVNDGTTFTAKFNDGNVLTLAIGSKGTVTTPQLGVNPETGKWMLNGSDTPYNAVGANSSVDGDKPEFNIALDNSTRQYYWQVRFGDSERWDPVTDAEGNKVVYVTEVDGELAKDNLFKDAKVEENEFVLTYYTNGDGQDPTNEVRIPIISDLSCVINVLEKDMADGYWEIGKEGASAEVEIKGDHCFVIAPHGWEASISETLTDGKAILTVKKSATASAGLKSRATANNTDEVVVQVNKGMYWAVAKVKVREAVTSYYSQVYDQGGDITVGNVTINKATYPGGIPLSTKNATITKDGVYFIPQGVDAVISSTSFNKLVLISDNPKGEPVTVDNTDKFNVTGIAGEFIAQNVIFKKENNPFMQIDATGITLKNLVLDGCKVTIASGKNFLNAFKGGDNSIGNIYLEGNRFAFNQTADYQASRLFNFSGTFDNVLYSRNLSADVSIINNVFYSTTNNYTINGTILFLGNDDTAGVYDAKKTVTIENNTFINFICGSQPMVRGRIEGAVVFRNLLLWSDVVDSSSKAKNSYLLNVHSKTPSGLTFENLLKFDKNKQIQTNYWHSLPSGYTQTKVEAASSDPFDVSAGATFDLENGVFIPTAEYANYGAQQR